MYHFRRYLRPSGIATSTVRISRFNLPSQDFAVVGIYSALSAGRDPKAHPVLDENQDSQLLRLISLKYTRRSQHTINQIVLHHTCQSKSLSRP
jgi:hypothetical protein